MLLNATKSLFKYIQKSKARSVINIGFAWNSFPVILTLLTLYTFAGAADFRTSASEHFANTSFCAGIQSHAGADFNSPKKPTGTFMAAAIQSVSEFGNVRKNLQHHMCLVTEAAQHGADVVVLPELAISGYLDRNLKTTWGLPGWVVTKDLNTVDPGEYSQPVSGEVIKAFSDLAAKYRIYVVVPLLEYDQKQEKFYNTIVLIDPTGRTSAQYRKINPWPFAEQSWASKGDLGNVFVDTPFGRMGLLICYDINFEPEKMKKLGIDHLLYSIAWVDKKESTWFTNELPGIAQKNNFNIIGANWTIPADMNVDWHGYGQSVIISRHGRTLAKAAAKGEQIIYAELPVCGIK
jgi:predicted amidohydrolase